MYFGIEAFLPGSQIDVKPIRDYDVLREQNMEFKVVKINHEFKNVVVSHKALIEAELENRKKKSFRNFEKGQVLEGTVKNITSYGVFIDLGGVDGLFTSPTFHGVAYHIRTKLLNWTKKSTWLSSISMMRKNVSLLV
jgi:ribosomal protein S1